ncbi:hypothetical protein SVAN01_00609 [Stagonosporopsis vannaccii]|nr:hypothetical protein SVAN01_00609 [Stagonosporopsis vannaccii]
MSCLPSATGKSLSHHQGTRSAFKPHQHHPGLSLIPAGTQLILQRTADVLIALTHFAVALLFTSVSLQIRYAHNGVPCLHDHNSSKGDRHLDISQLQHHFRHNKNMVQPTLLSPRKRPSPDDGASSDDCNTPKAGPAKHQRTLSLDVVSPPKFPLSNPGADCPPTPPSSVAGVATMALKLVIPIDQISPEQQKTLKRHRADAERWKPKLQRPYPKRTETKNAYPLKLMRHYPDTTGAVQPDFIKPQINKSPRLTHLLQQFPFVDTTQHVRRVATEDTSGLITPPGLAVPMCARGKDLKRARLEHIQLHSNIQVTRTEYAQHLAWKSFSLPEQGRLDHGREAMVLSGLPTADLREEGMGHPNVLPDWRKPWTGHFATRQQGAG